MMPSTGFKWSASWVPLRSFISASAAQRAARASGLVLHALVVLPRPENRLAIGQGDAKPSRTAFGSSPVSENNGQEGFDALIHRAFPPLPPASSPCGSVEARETVQSEKLLPARHGLSDAAGR